MYRENVLFVRIDPKAKKQLNLIAENTHRTKGEILEKLISNEFVKMEEFIHGRKSQDKF